MILYKLVPAFTDLLSSFYKLNFIRGGYFVEVMAVGLSLGIFRVNLKGGN